MSDQIIIIAQFSFYFNLNKYFVHSLENSVLVLVTPQSSSSQLKVVVLQIVYCKIGAEISDLIFETVIIFFQFPFW